jgi:arylsulfatase A-like enzyme
MLTDDQRWDAVGFVQRRLPDGRFPFLRQSTPNIDRIAATGVWFNNAFVAESLCSPSRAAFLTGKYNHTNGIVNNHTAFPVNAQTYATLLRAAGYRTGYFGKWHMGSQRARPGFDHYASFVGQGRYFDCPLIVNGVDTPTVGWVDDVTTTYAVNFVASSANRPQPFLMVLGFKTTHGPHTPPARTNALFSTTTIDTPPNATSYPPYFVDPRPSTFGGVAFRNYFRATVGMDQNVGRVLNALDSAGIAEDTIVVFASDNGFHMREHGSYSPVQTDGEKRSAYEASIRIPLLVRYPRLTGAGRTIGAAVMNVDLAPTLLQLAGLQPGAGMQGKSWVPLLNGTATSVRNGIFYEYFRESGFVVPRIMAFRRDGLKLIRYPDHPEYGREFYDLRVDPWETNNRIADPTVRTQVEAMSRAMANAAARLGYHIPAGADPQF